MSTSTTVKKGLSFAKEVLAKLKGDDNQALSEKIARKAISAVESQISSLNSKEVDLENELDDANEALHDAKYPTAMFTSGQDYINGIQKAQNRVDDVEEKLETLRASIKYFNALLASF